MEVTQACENGTQEITLWISASGKSVWWNVQSRNKWSILYEGESQLPTTPSQIIKLLKLQHPRGPTSMLSSISPHHLHLLITSPPINVPHCGLIHLAILIHLLLALQLVTQKIFPVLRTSPMSFGHLWPHPDLHNSLILQNWHQLPVDQILQ